MNYINLVVSTLLLVVSISNANEDSENYEDPFCSMYELYDKCTKNKKGYSSYVCNNEKESFDKIREVFCYGGEECECDWTADDEYRCWCKDTTGLPSFPDTGIIRWNGSYTDDGDMLCSRCYDGYVYGEIHKSSYKRYMLIETKVFYSGSTKVEFEIIMPSSIEGTFIKYTGNSKDKKSCRRSVVKETKNLREILKNHWATRYELVRTTPMVKKKGVVIQEWTQHHVDDYTYGDWKFTLEYDYLKQVAIPLSLKQDYWFFDEGTDKRDVKYQYQPITKDDEPTFELEDYCIN